MDEEPQQIVRRCRRYRLIAPGLILLIALALALLWVFRLPIAADYVRRELDERGVRATYRVTGVGFGRQRVENLVIGDPRNPDLTARWVELRLSWGFRKPRVTLITARGVRLRGRLADGRITLGEVDKLLPPPTGLPFRFPDETVDVADASIRLDTPAGRIGLAVAGKGNLADGFRGEMAAMSNRLQLGSCGLVSPRAYWRVRIDILRPTFTGPASATSLACGKGFSVERPDLALEATLGPALSVWTGKAGVRAPRVRFSDNSLSFLAGSFSFEGDSKSTKGDVDLAASAARVAGLRAGRTQVDGRYSLSPASGAFSLMADAGARNVSAAGPLEGLADALASAGGTPVEQVGEALAAALRRAAVSMDVAGSLRLVSEDGSGGVRFERLLATSRSGARLSLQGGQGVTYAWPAGLARVDGDVALSGGGFPTSRFSLRQPRLGGPVEGVGRIAAMSVGSSRLALGEIRFTAAPGGATRIDTTASLDGAVEDGRIEGLAFPISGRVDGRGGFAFGPGCVTARFRSFRTGTLRLGDTVLPLCPTGRALVWMEPGGKVRGGASVRSPRLAGTLGTSPLSLASSRLVFGLDGPSLDASDVSVALAAHRFQLDSLTGRFDRPGAGGAYAGLRGKLGAVPLLLSEGAGRWTVRDGDVSLQGRMKVADQLAPPRFFPLVSEDFRLSLVDNRISAAGWLIDPETGTRIVQASIDHALRTGRGRAVLDVPGIRFDEKYQPEQLTRLTTGVVALVDGVLSGRGEIAGTGRGRPAPGPSRRRTRISRPRSVRSRASPPRFISPTSWASSARRGRSPRPRSSAPGSTSSTAGSATSSSRA